MWTNLYFLAISVALTLGATPRAGAQPRDLTLEQALRLAHSDNPQVRQERENVAAAQARVAGASTRVRENPSLTVTAGPRSSRAGTSLDFGVQILQPFDIGGQRGARVRAAEAGVGAAQAQIGETRQQLAAEVRLQFGRALAADARRQLAQEAWVIVQEGLTAAGHRVTAGAAPVLERNAARVEVGRATRERAQAERALEVAHANLVLLLAVREGSPALRVGVAYSREQESEASISQGIVSVDLPLFQRNVAARGVTAARVRQLALLREEVERRIKQQVLTALGRLRAAEAAAQGYDAEVLQAMRDNLNLVTESYRLGKSDFLQLAIMRRQAVEAKREYIDILEERYAAWAELDLALGRSAPSP